MTIPFKISSTTVLTFDITNQDISIPRGKVSATPNQNTASLCTSVQCFNCNTTQCTEVKCSSVQCTQVKCNEVRCSNCTTVKCDCDCNSDS